MESELTAVCPGKRVLKNSATAPLALTVRWTEARVVPSLLTRSKFIVADWLLGLAIWIWVKPTSWTSEKTNGLIVFEDTSAPSRNVKLPLNIRKKPTILLTVLSSLNQPTGLPAGSPGPKTCESTIGSCVPLVRVLVEGLVILDPLSCAPFLSKAVRRIVASTLSRLATAIPVYSLLSGPGAVPSVVTRRG